MERRKRNAGWIWYVSVSKDSRLLFFVKSHHVSRKRKASHSVGCWKKRGREMPWLWKRGIKKWCLIAVGHQRLRPPVGGGSFEWNRDPNADHSQTGNWLINLMGAKGETTHQTEVENCHPKITHTHLTIGGQPHPKIIWMVTANSHDSRVTRLSNKWKGFSPAGKKRHQHCSWMWIRSS